MDTLFLALAVLVFALLALLLWFVPHLLQQQARHVASETTQLREMLLDLLNEQEGVTLRQSQLGGSFSGLREHLELLAREGMTTASNPQLEIELQRIEMRIGEMHSQMQGMAQRQPNRRHGEQDNESWANLMTLLASMQGRIAELGQEQASQQVAHKATVMLQDLEQEMQRLNILSEDIDRLQRRMRRSLAEREHRIPFHTRINGA